MCISFSTYDIYNSIFLIYQPPIEKKEALNVCHLSVEKVQLMSFHLFALGQIANLASAKQNMHSKVPFRK